MEKVASSGGPEIDFFRIIMISGEIVMAGVCRNQTIPHSSAHTLIRNEAHERMQLCILRTIELCKYWHRKGTLGSEILEGTLAN